MYLSSQDFVFILLLCNSLQGMNSRPINIDCNYTCRSHLEDCWLFWIISDMSKTFSCSMIYCINKMRFASNRSSS